MKNYENSYSMEEMSKNFKKIKIERLYNINKKTNEYYIDGIGWVKKTEFKKVLTNLSIKEKWEKVLYVKIKYYEIFEDGQLYNEGYEEFSKIRYFNKCKENGINTKPVRGKGQFSFDLRTYKEGKGYKKVTDTCTAGNFNETLMGPKKIIKKFFEFKEAVFLQKGFVVNIWKV